MDMETLRNECVNMGYRLVVVDEDIFESGIIIDQESKCVFINTYVTEKCVAALIRRLHSKDLPTRFEDTTVET